MYEELDSFCEGFFHSLQNEESNTETYMEAYYGRLPEFEQISKLFDIMSERATKEKDRANPNEYTENKQIQKLFAKVFGLKRVYLYWMPHPGPNACTIVIYSIMINSDSEKFIEHDPKKGFYDNSHKSIFTVYGYNDILTYGLTGKELTAIFLHEFGHNFDFSPYHIVEYFQDYLYGLTAKNIGTDIEKYNDIKLQVKDDLVKEANKLYNHNRTRDRYRRAYNKYLDEDYNKSTSERLKIAIKMLGKNTFMHTLGIPIRLFVNIADIGSKKGEQFADSFATAYGYGPDLLSGLSKLDVVPKAVKIQAKGPVCDFLRDLNEVQYEVLDSMMEEHGSHAERCRDCLMKLRRDLKTNDFPPDMRSDLENEIARLEERYVILTSVNDEQKNKMLAIYRKMMDKFFHGSNNFAKFFKPNQV